MGYLIRMAPEVGVWLASVRDRDPAAADLIDEAVAALRAGGESVGPPLVVPVDDPPLNARPDLDAAYGRQLERLTRVRRAVADAATSRKRLELEAGRLEQHLVKVDEQIRNALETGRGGLAEQAGERRRAAEERLAEMRRLHTGMQAEEERLTMASHRARFGYKPINIDSSVCLVISRVLPGGSEAGGLQHVRARQRDWNIDDLLLRNLPTLAGDA